MVATRGGDKFDAAMREIARKLSNARSVQVGFLEGSAYSDGTPIAMVAAINEYGAPSRGQPPRPFMRNMIAKQSPRWPELITAALKAADYDARKALTQVGAKVAGQVQESIIELTDPPLAPSTLRRRKVDVGTIYDAGDESTFGAKPLINTGAMLSSVGYAVKD